MNFYIVLQILLKKAETLPTFNVYKNIQEVNKYATVIPIIWIIMFWIHLTTSEIAVK